MRVAICDSDQDRMQQVAAVFQEFGAMHGLAVQAELFADSEALCADCAHWDLAFLAEEIRPMNGVEAARRLRQQNPDLILFFLASSDLHIDAVIDLQAFRIFKPPLHLARLRIGIEKARPLIAAEQNQIRIEIKKRVVTLAVNEILYIEIVGRQTTVVLTSQTLRTPYTMEDWCQMLHAQFFYQVHKSFLINMHYITDYSRSQIQLAHTYEIPIAPRQQTAFYNRYRAFLREQSGAAALMPQTEQDRKTEML